jgi:hypothetical protein
MEGRIKKNEGFYEGGKWRCGSQKTQWALHETS